MPKITVALGLLVLQYALSAAALDSSVTITSASVTSSSNTAVSISPPFILPNSTSNALSTGSLGNSATTTLAPAFTETSSIEVDFPGNVSTESLSGDVSSLEQWMACITALDEPIATEGCTPSLGIVGNSYISFSSGSATAPKPGIPITISKHSAVPSTMGNFTIIKDASSSSTRSTFITSTSASTSSRSYKSTLTRISTVMVTSTTRTSNTGSLSTSSKSTSASLW